MVETLVPEPLSDGRNELRENVFALGPADGVATALREKLRSRSAGEIGWRPFDEEPVDTPDEGDVRQVSAVGPRRNLSTTLRHRRSAFNEQTVAS